LAVDEILNIAGMSPSFVKFMSNEVKTCVLSESESRYFLEYGNMLLQGKKAEEE